MSHRPVSPQMPSALLIWLLRLYPRRWRERYEQEMVAVLEQHPATLRTYLSLTWCALETRLDPSFVAKEFGRMLQAVRASVLAVLWAGLAFLMASVGFVQMAHGLGPQTPSRMLAGPASFLLTTLAALTAFAGSLPVVTGLVRQAITTRQLRFVVPLVVPVGAWALLLGTTALIAHVVAPSRAVWGDSLPDSMTDLGGHLGLFLWGSLLLLLLVVSGVAITRTVAQAPLDIVIWRFTLPPAGILTLAMAVVTGAAVVFGLRPLAPALLSGAALYCLALPIGAALRFQCRDVKSIRTPNKTGWNYTPS